MENQIVTHRKKGGLTKLGETTLIEKLSDEMKLNKIVIKRISEVFKKYVKDDWYMDLPLFSEFLHNSFGLIDGFFMKRIFLAADNDRNRCIDLEEFIRLVVIMLYGTMEERIKLCFYCYDLSQNNELNREDITSLLLEALNEPPTKKNNADALRDLVEAIITKFDKDGDGVISFEEFKTECVNDWLLMEAFGQIIPDHRHRAAFLVLLEAGQEVE